jgi:hypothetical protein
MDVSILVLTSFASISFYILGQGVTTLVCHNSAEGILYYLESVNTAINTAITNINNFFEINQELVKGKINDDVNQFIDIILVAVNELETAILAFEYLKVFDELPEQINKACYCLILLSILLLEKNDLLIRCSLSLFCMIL